jgi:tRNA(Ile)-lysidine synthase
MHTLENLGSILKDRCGLTADRPIVVGVSGGPDSLCLLQLLHQASYAVQVAHFNHRLRPESDAEAGAVEAIAAEMRVPFVSESAEVRAFSETGHLSIEEAARHLRYGFLFDQARRSGAQAVAVGHTADDQVETVLMHFLRGAGLNGLKGMPYRTILPVFDRVIPIVRPLLDAWRAQTVAYCTAHGLQPQHDPSNDSLEYLRNRLRNSLIPELERYNPGFREAVLRSAHTLGDDHALLQELLNANWNACVVDQAADRITFTASGLGALPVALRRQLVRRALETLRPGLESTYAVLERAAAFIGDPAGPKQADLTGGLRMSRERDCIHVATSGSHLPSDGWPQMPEEQSVLSLACPGQTGLADGWSFVCEPAPWTGGGREQAGQNADPFHAWLDADRLTEPLALRARRPGDRFEPLGLDGHSQKLSDFFVNEKLPQRARARWPLLCMGDTVVWVPGYRPAHSYRLTSGTRNALHVAVRRNMLDRSTKSGRR